MRLTAGACDGGGLVEMTENQGDVGRDVADSWGYERGEGWEDGRWGETKRGGGSPMEVVEESGSR